MGIREPAQSGRRRGGLLMRRLVALGLIIAAFGSGGIARAQSIDTCMRAEPAAAIPLCEALIAAGEATAAVHVQLVLSLDKTGRTADARQALDRGLGAWSSDRDLLDLRERLTASTSEREQLEQAGERNASALSQGRLRLLCLTRNDTTGADACREHLSSTDKDGERLRERLAGIERELAASDPSTEVASARTPVTPPAGSDSSSPPAAAPPPSAVDESDGDPTPVQPFTPSEQVENAAPPRAADVARRARVADIQRALNAMGFDVGRADGIPGRRTREALANFAAQRGIDDVLSFDEQTLARLDEARAEALARAQAEEAGEAARAEARRIAGDAEARRIAEDAEARRIAGDAEARRIAEDAEARRIAGDAEARSLAGDAERDDALAAGSATTATEPVVANDAASLMTRIGTLERRLADDSAALARIDARLRALVERTLAADSTR